MTNQDYLKALIINGKSQKNYGSIPHFKDSRLGPGDYYACPGHIKMVEGKLPPDRRAIIGLKYDGANVGIYAPKRDVLIPLTRNGYDASKSDYLSHQTFAQWLETPRVKNFFRQILAPGERIVGEWMAIAVGTRYEFPRGVYPFVFLDWFDKNNERIIYNNFWYAAVKSGINFYYGGYWNFYGGANNLKEFQDELKQNIFDMELDLKPPLMPIDKNGNESMHEGYVIRVLRRDKKNKDMWRHDFMIKWVRPGKVDGKYMDQNIYNWRPS